MSDIDELGNVFGMEEFVEGDDPMTTALAYILNMPEGRTLLYGIIAQANVYADDFNGNSRDIFNKGKRSIGLWLIGEIGHVDPTSYPRMLLDVARQAQKTEHLEAIKQKENP